MSHVGAAASRVLIRRTEGCSDLVIVYDMCNQIKRRSVGLLAAVRDYCAFDLEYTTKARKGAGARAEELAWTRPQLKTSAAEMTRRGLRAALLLTALFYKFCCAPRRSLIAGGQLGTSSCVWVELAVLIHCQLLHKQLRVFWIMRPHRLQVSLPAKKVLYACVQRQTSSCFIEGPQKHG